MDKHIPCSEYDYFEIACTYSLEVKLLLTNGETILGIAKGLSIERKNGIATEWLTLTGEDNKIQLTQIQKLTAITKNPHFDQVQLHPPS